MQRIKAFCGWLVDDKYFQVQCFFYVSLHGMRDSQRFISKSGVIGVDSFDDRIWKQPSIVFQFYSSSVFFFLFFSLDSSSVLLVSQDVAENPFRITGCSG